jgi:hypothetical protein
LSHLLRLPGALVLGSTLCGIVSCSGQALRETTERLEQRTDHQELLTASREILAHQAAYRAHPVVPTHQDPKDPQLPNAIRDLAPRDIVVEDDYVRLILNAGDYERVDVIAFREGVADQELAGGIGKGHRLVPGLWYYENWGE